MTLAEEKARSRAAAIGLILAAMAAITTNDMLVKRLSETYALHQIVFIRSVIGLASVLPLVVAEGGWRAIRVRRPGLHALRSALVVATNFFFFAGLAALPLGLATGLFFVGPILITVFSVLLLGERVGPHRTAAVAVGFLGTVLMVRTGAGTGGAGLLAALLPLAGATAYALSQILTRKLGPTAGPAAMAFWIQGGFVLAGAAVGLAIGDGRLAEAGQGAAMAFATRAWTWPGAGDLWIFLVIGVLIGSVSWTLSQAYRIAPAATVAPFEYTALPMAVLWGWAVFGEVPAPSTLLGILLIAGAGIWVFLRERKAEKRA